MKLTDKQEKFVQELMKGRSQREAYKIAYPKSKKWTDNAIDSRASRLLNSDKVLTRYNQLKDRLVKEAEDECIVTAKEVLREYKKIAFADIKDYLEYKTDLSIVGYEDGEPITDYKQVVALKPSNEVDGSVINEISIAKDGTLKFKLHDKKGALDAIAKHLGMFVEKVEHSGNMNINNPYKDLTTEELKKLAQMSDKK